MRGFAALPVRCRLRAPLHARRLTLALFVATVLITDAAIGGSVRDQTRLFRKETTSVTEDQASELTLTLTETAIRSIQSWIRTAGRLDEARTKLTAFVPSSEARWVQPGQRVRAFSVSSRTQMQQGKVTRVDIEREGARVEVTLAGQPYADSALYLMEIVADRGRYLSVPNTSILEEENRHIVYVQTSPGQFARREVHTGLQGELYTEVVEGLKEGDQVAAIGSFFLDADIKLKSGTDEP